MMFRRCIQKEFNAAMKMAALMEKTKKLSHSAQKATVTSFDHVLLRFVFLINSYSPADI